MLKDILKLNGVEEVTKKEQKTIVGSGPVPIACVCPDGSYYVSNSGNCANEIDRFCLLDS